MNRLREKTMATLLIAIFMISLFTYLPTFAADEEEIEESIVKGLTWLAGDQNEDGSWGSWERLAHTGLAVLKFIDRAKELGKDPFGVEYEYHTQVEEGMEFIFSHANEISISPQPAGDPDSDGDDIGVYIADSGHWSYTTGISLMAISAAKPYAPGPVPTGPLVGWTYADVITDTVDYLAMGQTDEGSGRGGWGYTHNFDWCDNSNTGYVTLGLGYAMASGATIPQFVLDELNIWIDYIQNDVDGYEEDGGSGYSGPDDWVNMLKTGNLLYQMALVGDTAETPRVIDAIDYQERLWNDPTWDPGWKGPGPYSEDWAHHQATFCIMKGFEALDIDTITVGATEVNWFDEMSDKIIDTQNEDGSWYGDYFGSDILSTTWALLTLQKTVEVPRTPVFVDIKPGSWPNPINKGSEGVFSAAICGTDEFDVMTINPETVKIYFAGVSNGVPPLRWSYEDVATPYTGEPGGGHELEGDGYMDLVLHFDTQEVVEVLELCEYDDETVPLIIRGNLLDEHGGSAFEGQDYVWLKVPKGKGKPDPQPPPTSGHPLEGMTIQIGMTSASSAGMENTVILAEQIIEPKINEYVSGLGLDITFDFIVEDNEGQAVKALENTQYFKSIGIDLIIGHGWSSQCQASLPYVNENDMLLLSSSSTSPILAIPEDRLFRTCPPDDVQGPAVAEMWETWGIEAVLTMHRADSWGDGIWNVLEPLWEPAGIEDLGRIRYPGDTEEFSMYLAQANDIITEAIAEYGIDKVGMQFMSFAELRTIQNQAADYPNLIDIIWMTTESGGRNQQMLDEAGEWAVQTRHFSSLMTVDEGSFLYQEFDEMYYDLTGLSTSFYTATQYDAAWLMVETILKTASIDPSVIAESLIPTSYMMHGISGWMALDENGDRMPQTFDIWGLYEDPVTHEYTFGKFGIYDAPAIEVYWDDGFLEYTGITRPGK